MIFNYCSVIFHYLYQKMLSPPHTRRKCNHCLCPSDADPFTSAHTEKIYLCKFYCFLRPVHLRTRGENLKHDILILNQTGSPPHTRRKCRLCLRR